MSTGTTAKRAKSITVAEFLTQQLALSPKSQRTIGNECGYENPNVITMIKQGSTKLPINKVGLMAKALGLDPRYLLRLVMEEYAPETWDVLTDILGREASVADEEMEIIGVMREATGGPMPSMGVRENREAITLAVQECIARDQARNTATVNALNALPRNTRGKE